MWHDFTTTVRNIQFTDLVDILIVAALFYGLFQLLRRTRSPLALRGLVGLMMISFVAYFLASMARLTAVQTIFERFWVVIVLAFVIIFQNDIKLALAELGKLRGLRAIFSSNIEYIDEIVSATAILANKKIGMLLVIERDESLSPYAEPWTQLDAAVNEEILRTIFSPSTPLHDGAVIVRNERIAAAGAILPLSESPGISRDLGTRHRAAIGLCEETDAVAVVVSEETGVISIAHRGQIERGLTPDELRASLLRLMTQENMA